MKSFSVQAKVWLWPGDTGWHFVTLDKSIYDKVRKVYPKGFVKVEVKLGKSTWDTSLFPHKLSGYLVCIKNSIRKKENIFAGDTVHLKIRFK